MKKCLALIFFTIALVGCMSSAVNKTFQKPEEIYANNRAEWVPIAKNAYGTVYFDPYQLVFYNSNTFRVPLRVSISETATGNWNYELNCDSTKGRFLSTLGGSGESKDMDFPQGSIGYIAKQKICGQIFSGKPYAFIAADTGRNEFYYSKNDIEQNLIVSDIYRFSILSFGTNNSNWSSGQLEINCKDQTSRPNTSTPWTKPPKRSPANVLIYQFCRSNKLVNRSYGNATTNNTQKNNPELLDYLNKLNNTSKQLQQSPSQNKNLNPEPLGMPSVKKDNFDWQQFYKN